MTQLPKLMVVDFRITVDRYRKCIGLYEIYHRFPITEIIEFLLSIPAYTNYDELIMIETERRFKDVLDDINLEHISFFYELLATEIDNQICKHFRTDIDSSNYDFVKWLDHTSAIIRLG